MCHTSGRWSLPRVYLRRAVSRTDAYHVGGARPVLCLTPPGRRRPVRLSECPDLGGPDAVFLAGGTVHERSGELAGADALPQGVAVDAEEGRGLGDGVPHSGRVVPVG